MKMDENEIQEREEAENSEVLERRKEEVRRRTEDLLRRNIHKIGESAERQLSFAF
jgi:hypothetical protein